MLEKSNTLLKEKFENIQKENNSITNKLMSQAKSLTNTNTINTNSGKNTGDFIANFNKINEANSSNGLKNRKPFPAFSEKSLSNKVKISQKKLSRDQINDLINEIYKSKENFDNQCIETNRPFETMEQHLYQFLNY